MKLNMSKEWFEETIGREGDLEVGAGSARKLAARDEPPWEQRHPREEDRGEFVELCALGSLVQLLRRSKGLSVEQLAERARVDLVDIIAVERDPTHPPRPRTVHKLAAFFGLPERPLVRLSNLTTARSTKLRDAAVRFAAHSSKVMELTPEEHGALAEFVEFLSSQAKS